MSGAGEEARQTGLANGWHKKGDWLPERLRLVQAHRGPVLLVARADFGPRHLMAGLQETLPGPVWLELSPPQQGDEVAQGNALAEAVQRALGSPLFEYGLPYTYGLGLLSRHLDLLGPFTFLLSGAQFAPDFAADLLALHRGASRVVLEFEELPQTFRQSPAALVVTEGDLRLRHEEALGLVAGRLSEGETEALWKESCGAFVTFSDALHRRLHLPAPPRPAPAGPQSAEPDIAPDILLKILVKQGKWLEALELAASLLPERVPEVLEEAGHVYHERGLHRRLWELIGSLNVQDETVLFWQLSAAAWQGEAEWMRDKVEAYLANHEAPELRALYGGSFSFA